MIFARYLLVTFLFLVSFILTNSESIFAFPSIYPKGTTIYDRDQTSGGFTLYGNLADGSVVLINMDGDIVHTWERPGYYLFGNVKPVDRGKGHVLSIARSHTSQNDGLKKLGLIELDWDSNIIWEYFDSKHSVLHHDFQRLENGNTLILLTQRVRSPDISPNPILDDYIIEVDSQGVVVWEWHTVDHFNEFGFSDEAKQLISEAPTDWAHTNSIQSLPENSLNDSRFKKGNILVSQRKTNIIFIIDKDTKHVVWKIGPDDNLTIGQHHITMIAQRLIGEGNIQVFDNGGVDGYPLQARLYSRFIEIDPLSKEVVYSYNASISRLNPFTFFGPHGGSVQKLSDGNILIVECPQGRIFEITSTGTIVWEYINPFIFNETEDIWSNDVYRAVRTDPDWPPPGFLKRQNKKK